MKVTFVHPSVTKDKRRSNLYVVIHNDVLKKFDQIDHVGFGNYTICLNWGDPLKESRAFRAGDLPPEEVENCRILVFSDLLREEALKKIEELKIEWDKVVSIYNSWKTEPTLHVIYEKESKNE